MKKLLLAVLLLAALLGGALLLARYERYEWSTDSAAALAAFEAGQDAISKLYRLDAIDHFERALQEDPDFAAGQLFLALALRAQGGEAKRVDGLFDDLRHQDLERLNERERALISFYLSRADNRHQRAGEILGAYLARHPDDPYLLELRCMNYFDGDETEDAEACLTRLIALDPNRVQAQNLLAYMAMNRGDFQRAEERFEVYGYLAPDQANPHDSLGELLMVTGRYDAAEAEFRKAVEAKPDFCPSWANLLTLAVLRRDPEQGFAVLAELEAAGGCPAEQRPQQRCELRLWSLAMEERWDEAWELGRGDCAYPDAEVSLIALRGALASGRYAEAEAFVEEVVEWFRRERKMRDPREQSPIVILMDGVELSGSGEEEAAVDPLRRADQGVMWGGSLGTQKLYARLELVAALAAVGQDGEARALLQSLRKVNPRYAADPPLPPLHPLPVLDAPDGPAAQAAPTGANG